MSILKSGQAHITARARVMLLLGEQLITDEVAAVAELVKNSYDADATKVSVSLTRVSEPEKGNIVIKDNGCGMTLEKVLSSWLELGTLSKAREEDQKARFSERLKRVYLGEKGLGRLAVHKLGKITELITKSKGSNQEAIIKFDWIKFEKSQGFLEEVPIEWEIRDPQVFGKSIDDSGTQITISNLRRCWTPVMLERVYRSIKSLMSPFESFSDFDILIEINDKSMPEIDIPDMMSIINKATYSMSGVIDELGLFTYRYSFNRPDIPELRRENKNLLDIRDPDHFKSEKNPRCGEFKIRIYAWDFWPQDLRAVFGDTSIREMIKQNSGLKVFRDGFRVLPYGNENNDWLSMDLERVKQFEVHVSRNQVIGVVEISSKTNPLLLDKTDREGLIDNDAFRDFHSLVKEAITTFEAERYPDRRKLKEATGRTRDELRDRTSYTESLSALTSLVDKAGIDTETRIKINKLIGDARDSLDNLLSEKEQPLLVAASIGLTYMMPTHEVRRELHESLKLLRSMREKGVLDKDQVESVISLLRQADEVVSGIGKLMQKSSDDQSFPIERAVKNAFQLMNYKLKRNDVNLSLDIRDSSEVQGSDRLTTVMILNFLDNSLYWLQRNNPSNRQIKIITETYDDDLMLIVSDSGPGFKDDINAVTLPFFTRKPNGMGLGLYIADRITRMNGGRLRIIGHNELPGLLPGANIAVILKKAKR